jgi:hypothetical protein
MYRYVENSLREKKSVTLIFFYIILISLLVVFGSFMSRGIVENKATLGNRDALQAYYLAEAGIDEVKRGLYDAFLQAHPQPLGLDFTWFDSLPDASKYVLPANAVLNIVPDGTYTVNITNVANPVGERRDVTLVCNAQVNNISKSITVVASYALRPSRVFDYSYFVNNFGWFYGGGITSQGDIRSNGNFSFNGNPKVNGDIYASVNPDLGAAGDITGNSRNDSLDYYRDHADDSARPTNPTTDSLGDYEYPNGYDGESERFPQEEVLTMPYLGDLSYYENLAASENGTIKQGGATIVDNTLEGSVVLIGTEDNPIEIDGPVVVTGDVLIKGVVKGQGTIFSGRNTHVIGNITYKDSPTWPKPDEDPDTTDTENATKDFLGLATKGNIIVGDYTRNDWKTNVAPYLTPPFTQGYETDSTDSSIGYDSDGISGNGYWFDGDYTDYDGGTKADGSARKYYESSYNDSYVHSIAESSNQIRQIDAVVYTNHAFSGKVGAFTINGSIVGRDEAIIYSGSITMNYDLRVKNQGIAFYLPRELDLSHTQYLKSN